MFSPFLTSTIPILQKTGTSSPGTVKQLRDFSTSSVPAQVGRSTDIFAHTIHTLAQAGDLSTVTGTQIRELSSHLPAKMESHLPKLLLLCRKCTFHSTFHQAHLGLNHTKTEPPRILTFM